MSRCLRYKGDPEGSPMVKKGAAGLKALAPASDVMDRLGGASPLRSMFTHSKYVIILE